MTLGKSWALYFSSKNLSFVSCFISKSISWRKQKHLAKLLWLNTILQTSPVTHFLTSDHRKEDKNQKSTFPHPHLHFIRNFTYKEAESSTFSLFPEIYTQWTARWAAVCCTDGERKVEDQKHILNLREDCRVQPDICGDGGQHVVPTAHLNPHMPFR